MDISERLSEDGTIHDKERLKELRALPLERKIQITQARIMEFVERMGGVDHVVVSTSGGKDSAVLLHLARQIYPTIRCVFVNTGLEYPEIQAQARKQGAIFVRPTMQFGEVIREYGYPIVSKEVAEAIYYARRIRNAGEQFNTPPPKTQGINKRENDGIGVTEVGLTDFRGGRQSGDGSTLREHSSTQERTSTGLEQGMGNRRRGQRSAGQNTINGTNQEAPVNRVGTRFTNVASSMGYEEKLRCGQKSRATLHGLYGWYND